VLFASDRAGTLGAWLQEVESGQPKGSPVLVKPDLWNATLGQFIANGSFFYGVQTANRQVHLATLDPASGRLSSPPISITPAPLGRVGDPQWSPDGQAVSYISQSRAFTSSTIMIHALESGEVREIPLPHELKYSFHRWARDGKSLILSGVPKGRVGLFRMDLQTAQTTPLFMLDRETVFPGGRTFEITPDSRQAVYVKNFIPAGQPSVLDLVVRDLASQAERVLYRPAKPEFGLSIPLSPDGSMVAFVEGYERPELKVLPLKGGNPQKVGGDFIPRGNSPIAWSADGRALFVTRGVTGPMDLTNHEIWRVPLDGGPPTPVGIAQESITEFRLDPEGRRLAFAFGNASGELWVMEHILERPHHTARTSR
jgi:Tol biopolymer transport system component